MVKTLPVVNKHANLQLCKKNKCTLILIQFLKFLATWCMIVGVSKVFVQPQPATLTCSPSKMEQEKNNFKDKSEICQTFNNKK
jgi:hypothetical protein